MGILKKFVMKFSKIKRNLNVKITKMYVFNIFLETRIKVQNSCIFKSSMWKSQFPIVKNYYFVFGKICYFYYCSNQYKLNLNSCMKTVILILNVMLTTN